MVFEKSIVIPAFNPDERLVPLIEDLRQLGLRHIIVINDGSEAACAPIFLKLREQLGCTVLEHEKNKGKGQALKTGFRYFLDNCRDHVGLVTADADGQHRPHDIIRLSEKLDRGDIKTLYLGSRKLDTAVPLRSRVGNHITRRIFSFLSGLRLEDTQTGLRAIPRSLVEKFVSLPGDRYDFELNMLLYAGNVGVTISEARIDTIYLENNRSSHFNPILDSVRIYYVFCKFLLSSLSSTLLDFVLFSLFFFASDSIFFSLFFARLLASLYNFILNKGLVFNSRAKIFILLLKYYALLFGLVLVGYTFIRLTREYASLNVLLAKGIIETALFFVSFHIQHTHIFVRGSLKK